MQAMLYTISYKYEEGHRSKTNMLDFYPYGVVIKIVKSSGYEVKSRGHIFVCGFCFTG